MKIRYYLRGLGIGILVTSIFFLVSDSSQSTMSDEMIKARAKELGMSESVVLSELPVAEKDNEEIVEETVSEPFETETMAIEETISEETVSEEIVSEETVSEETVSEETVSEETVSEEAVSEETFSEETVSEETGNVAETTESTASNTEAVSVMVNRGEGSDTVSRRLQEAGLVADAYEYDRYLMANGYDKRIGAGEHIIPAGATWEEIAKILCNMN